jgi:hypothetical protein
VFCSLRPTIATSSLIKVADFFNIPFSYIQSANRNLPRSLRRANIRCWVLSIRGVSKGGTPLACFGYFSTRESTARPGEGQTKGYAKSCDKSEVISNR